MRVAKMNRYLQPSRIYWLNLMAEPGCDKIDQPGYLNKPVVSYLSSKAMRGDFVLGIDEPQIIADGWQQGFPDVVPRVPSVSFRWQGR